MKLSLAWRLNHRLVELRADTKGQLVGVLRRSGEYRYVNWLGFIQREEAILLGKPVKLQISRIGRLADFGTVWDDLPKAKHVQGCLTHDGAYAVVDLSVTVL